MKKPVVFQWIEPCRSERLCIAQAKLLESIEAFGLDPVIFRAGPEMVKFGEILKLGRENSNGKGFVWCNSDVIITRDPFDLPNLDVVGGFHRRELPSHEITYGVDMYYIPNAIWDNLLTPDMPDLWCGAATIDWWLTRACQKAGVYENHVGYIDHPSHERSQASAGGDRYFKHNVKHYNAWARRNGIGTLDTYVELPILGIWQNSLRSLWRKSR